MDQRPLVHDRHCPQAELPSQAHPSDSNWTAAQSVKLTHIHILLIRHYHSLSTADARYLQMSPKLATKRTHKNIQNNLPRLFFNGTVPQFGIMAQCR